ncbi:MRN complex-interacting protein [Bombus pascuorum]|uniref:MRN complex-interacting protein n=1 Tax=Bombus pascuorum TaxID=65598 RepID=UPI002142ED7D|nr:MRN complex-interacting protein [Bombus pascuorum]
MSQELNILRCYSCKTYQVHIVKKAKKWQCKICNFKQTFKQAYFKGSGRDCRVMVQKLNLMKEHEIQENISFSGCNSTNDNYMNNHPEKPKPNIKVESKWAKYLDTPEEIRSNTFVAADSQSSNYKKSDDIEHLDNNTMYECSQSEHTDIGSDLSYENDSKQDFIYDNEEEYDNFIPEEIDNAPCSNDNSKSTNLSSKNTTEIKSAKNIFDDNEDFDPTIDF